MPYTHSRFLFRQDGVPSDEQGTGDVPSGADPGSIGWNRPAGSKIVRTDTGDLFVFDGTNWDQQLNADSTFSDAADSYDQAIETIPAPLAPSGTAVHAKYNTGTNVNFPGAFSNPDVPRNIRIDYDALYDGGDTTVTGTDVADAPCVETIADIPGGSAYGTKVFKTVTAAVQQALGAGGVGASIGYGQKLGLLSAPFKPGVLSVDGTTESATWDNVAQSMGVTPTTLPDGAKNFTAVYPKTGATSTVTPTP